MSTILHPGRLYALCKGKSGKDLKLSCSLPEEEKKVIEEKITSFQSCAGRILAFAHKKLDHYTGEEAQEELETDLVYDGFVVISDPLSPDVYGRAIGRCRKAGIEVKMLTGDNILTARAIADQLHMLDADHIAVEASEIEAMSDDELTQALKKIQCYYRSTPLVKMRVVKALKAGKCSGGNR